MAKKNSGLGGMNFSQIMMQQATRSVEAPVYCRLCGKDVKIPSENSPGGQMGDWRRNLEWETQNQVHVKCAQNYNPQRR